MKNIAKLALLVTLALTPDSAHSSRLWCALANDNYDIVHNWNRYRVEAHLDELDEQGNWPHINGMYYHLDSFGDGSGDGDGNGNVWRSSHPPHHGLEEEDYEDAVDEITNRPGVTLAMGHVRLASSGCGDDGQNFPPNPHPFFFHNR